MRTIKITAFLFFIITQMIFIKIALCEEIDVSYVGVDNEIQNRTKEISIACDLMGVRLKTYYLKAEDKIEMNKIFSEAYSKEIIILSSRVLSHLDYATLSSSMRKDAKKKILILGIDTEVDIDNLKIWSKNTIKSLRKFDLPNNYASIRVMENDQISKELGGLGHVLSGIEPVSTTCFELKDTDGCEKIVELIDKSGKSAFPIFLKADSLQHTLFFLAEWKKLFKNEKNEFLKIMPIIMFLKYALGDRCWQGINDYANLTIDDPWLREPYGYISFKNLGENAKKMHFHVTIALIPYNYKKSRKDATQIFKQYHEQLSIAFHGNNHDFSEFRSGYNLQIGDIHPDEEDILQALYRMNKLSINTGIEPDRVMIFPRGVFTKESLTLLKKNNFLMTVNSSRPLGTIRISNDVDRIRGMTLEYNDFPMLLRIGLPVSTDFNKTNIATDDLYNNIRIRLFLDLPVLLYTHQQYFKHGNDRFNSIALFINEVQPEVVWANLGEIANRLYLQRRIGDNEIEILSFSSSIHLGNNYPAPIKYFFKKKEDFMIPIESVEVNGIIHEYIRDGKNLRFELLIEPNDVKNIQINYQSEYKIASFDSSDKSLFIASLRYLSDFRDLYISKIPFGDKAIYILYKIREINYIFMYILALIIISMIVLAFYFKRRISGVKKRT